MGNGEISLVEVIDRDALELDFYVSVAIAVTVDLEELGSIVEACLHAAGAVEGVSLVAKVC